MKISDLGKFVVSVGTTVVMLFDKTSLSLRGTENVETGTHLSINTFNPALNETYAPAWNNVASNNVATSGISSEAGSSSSINWMYTNKSPGGITLALQSSNTANGGACVGSCYESLPYDASQTVTLPSASNDITNGYYACTGDIGYNDDGFAYCIPGAGGESTTIVQLYVTASGSGITCSPASQVTCTKVTSPYTYYSVVVKPTPMPTTTPTSGPTVLPTTATPTAQPTVVPSVSPTATPTPGPTEYPSGQPTSVPTISQHPTGQPTGQPTSIPTISHPPTGQPTEVPTEASNDSGNATRMSDGAIAGTAIGSFAGLGLLVGGAYLLKKQGFFGQESEESKSLSRSLRDGSGWGLQDFANLVSSSGENSNRTWKEYMEENCSWTSCFRR